MSQYVTPFLVLNLGSEMIFVIAQRLQAQKVAQERATLVLEEIISVLISKPLIVDLMKPQSTHNHDSVRKIIEDVTQSSAMRLDPVSMSKLWDLITMVFKWQVSMSTDLVGITLRHLYEIENYITNPNTHQQLLRVQNLVDNFNKILDQREKENLHEEVLSWLKNYNVRVSLLLRMGLQSTDGNFVVNGLDPVAEDMLRNLGENIYQVTQNGRILENRSTRSSTNALQQSESVNELQHFVNEMLGQRHLQNNAESSHFKLSISDENANKARERRIASDAINVSVDDNKLDNLMSEMILSEEDEGSFKHDLLEMIGGKEN